MLCFQPNCTLPPEGVNYVAAPNTRSTLDIVWTSLATVIACTYSVLHLNVPILRRGRDPGWRGDVKWTSRRLAGKLGWCIVTVLLPECTFAKSLTDWLNARKELRLLRSCPALANSITLTHMLFADMGGFVLAYHSKTSRPPARQDDDSLHAASENRESHVPTETSRNVETSAKPTNGVISASTATIDHLLEQQYAANSVKCMPFSSELEYWHLDIPADLPNVEEIMDKSNTDLLARIITMLQISYFVISVIVRVVYDMPICCLDLGTAALVVCSVLTYMATFQKSRFVDTAMRLSTIASSQTMDSVRTYSRESGRTTILSSGAGGRPPRNEITRIVNDTDGVVPLILITTVLLSSIHVARWKLTFPSVADMWLWRLSAVIAAAAPLWLLVWVSILQILSHFDICQNVGQAEFILGIAGAATVVIYAIARLVLIVEMFRGLGFLPPDAFKATWTANVPHFG